MCKEQSASLAAEASAVTQALYMSKVDSVLAPNKVARCRLRQRLNKKLGKAARLLEQGGFLEQGSEQRVLLQEILSPGPTATLPPRGRMTAAPHFQGLVANQFAAFGPVMMAAKFQAPMASAFLLVAYPCIPSLGHMLMPSNGAPLQLPVVTCAVQSLKQLETARQVQTPSSFQNLPQLWSGPIPVVRTFVHIKSEGVPLRRRARSV